MCVNTCMTMRVQTQYPGHLLVANPNNPRDELSRSVILLVNHVDDIAIGIQINHPLDSMMLEEVAVNSNIPFNYNQNALLYMGGNVNNSRVHVIHSTDWAGVSTVKLTKDISITHDVGILHAIGAGKGPERFKACGGCWMWNNYKLDRQLDPHNPMESHSWEIAQANPKTVFGLDGVDMWRQAVDDAAHFNIAQWF